MTSELAIRSAQVHVPGPCAWCESIQGVNWYCNDCQEALCNGCKESHQRARKTRNDVVVPITRAIKEDQAILPDVCKTHHGKSCDLYCCDCEIVMCAICFTEKHSQHVFKNVEEEIDIQKQFLQNQLITLDSNLDHFNDNITKRHEVNKSFEENVDVIRQTVESQRITLQAEVDSIAEFVFAELSSLDKREKQFHDWDCQYHEKGVKEIKQLLREVEQSTEKKSRASLLEMTAKMRTTLPLYDVNKKSVVPTQSHFVLGELNQDQLKTMCGCLHVMKNEDVQYEKKEVDCQQVQMISTFQVPQQTQINSICPIDDTHAWMSVHESNELIKINKNGRVTEAVTTGFKPWCLTVTSTKELLITRYEHSLINKLSKDRRVTTFADISPLKALGISVRDDVFVTTLTPTILVLNMSGERLREVSCGHDGLSIVCLITGLLAVTTGHNVVCCKEMIVINKSDQIIHRWSGELDNGKKIEEATQCSIACDRFDRLFVPDCLNDQVYVLSRYEGKAKCLLDKKHGVTDPWTISVDSCGHVWIGCRNGTVHVMQI